MNSATFCGLFFGLLCWTCAAAQDSDCDITSPMPVTISETDPPMELLQVNGGPTATWTFRVDTMPVLEAYFRLEQDSGNASLFLKKTMDLEAVNEILGQIVNIIKGKLSCSRPAVPDVVYELYAFVTPVNEFPPEFVSLPVGGFDITEDTRVGDIVFTMSKYVVDKDVVPNHMGYHFTFLPYTADPQVDGRSVFSVQNNMTGSTTLFRQLDYEAMQAGKTHYILSVMVSDRDNTVSLTSSGTVKINVIDADDQPPEFYYQGCASPCFPSYSAALKSDFVGPITWLQPATIQARDRDTLGSPVTFNIKQGNPTYYAEYLTMDRQTGVPSVIKPADSAETASFLVIVEAVETTNRSNSEQTTLWLVIEGRNLSLPALPVSESTSDAFRIATIVLGCLLGLILIIFIVFVVLTTVALKKRTAPVQPRTIGKLSNDASNSTAANANENRNSAPSYRGESNGTTSRDSAARKVSGDSGVDFFRSMSSPSGGIGPALRPSSFLPAEQDAETLPANDEIYYTNSATRQRKNSRLPTSSAAEPGLYQDRVGLVGNLTEEVLGMANPVYDTAPAQERAVDVSVVPLEQAHVEI